MRINQEELQRRINSPKNLVNKLTVIKKEKRTYSPRMTPEVSNVVGITSKIDGPTKAAAEFGVSVHQARNAAAKIPDEKLGRVQDLALSMLMDSLGLLTPENISGEKPKDISQIAKNLSTIYNNTRSQDNNNGATIIVVAPESKRVKDYDIIEVRVAGD